MALTDTNEKLYRAVRPNDMYWKDAEKTKVSSAVFKDPKGLSVDRQGDRIEEDAITTIKANMTGKIVSITVGNCIEKSIIVDECPISTNKYHCEIIRSYENKQLTSSQAKHLAIKAAICG